jgi:acyl-CoA reductase-like NAD-dependent aldehyde dehydrogenase
MSTDRIIIHADIADQFLGALKATLMGFAESSPSPLHVVLSASKSRIQKLVSTALSEGASTLLGPTE